MAENASDHSEKKVDFANDVSEVGSEATSRGQSQSVEDGDESRTLWQNIVRYRKVTYVTFGLTSAILLYGYDNVIVGTISAMPPFQKDFGILYKGRWILPSTWLALWNVASPIGAMIGAIFGGWLQDRIGRRYALAISSFTSAIGVAIMFVSYLPSDITGRRVAFLVGKLFQGGAIGAAMAACQTYMSEILPPQLRGSGMAFFPAFTLLGQLSGALVIFGVLNRPQGYKVAFASQWPFSVVPVVVALLIPESPTWLVRKRKMDEAFKAQARLDPPGTNTKAIIDKILVDIEHEEQSAKATFTECFHRRNFRRTFIVMFANSLTASFGLQLLAKASYFLQLINLKPNLSIIFLILGLVLGLLANIVSIWVVSRFGRRTLVISTLLIASIEWGSMGVANCFKIVPAVTWWTAAAMMLVTVTCGVGVWPVSYAIAAETSSLQLRAKSQGIGWFVQSLTSTVAGLCLPYVFNPDQGNLRGKTGFTYMASCAVFAVVSYFIIPEMKGRNVAEIDRMFEEGVPAREFKKWKPVEGREVPVKQPWV